MQKVVLVVDDDPDFRGSLKDSFISRGFDVLEAENGLLALQIVLSTSVDLVVTDVDMPIKNGIEFLRELRIVDSTTPVIVMSGGSKCSEETALLLGATAFIQKPFPKIEALFALIAS